MSETNPEKPRALNTALGVGASSVAGAVTGMYAVNNVLRPPTVEFMPEEIGAIEATASLKSEEGVTVINGVTRLELPNVPIETPIGDIGINLHLTKLDQAIKDPETINNLTSLIKKHEVAIEEPIKDALYSSLSKGAGLGAIVGGLTGYLLVRKYRNLKDSGKILSIKELIPRRMKKKQAIIASCAALAISSSAAAGYQISSETKSSIPEAPTTPLPAAITDRSDLLEGARIIGFGADLIDIGIKLVKAYDDDVTNTFAITKENFSSEFSKYNIDKSYLKTFGSKPGFKTVMHVSDMHCNYAMYENALAPIYSKFKPSIILNTGDTFSVGNIIPLEDACMDDFRKAVSSTRKNTLIVNTIGNHDGKDPINIDSNPKVITPSDQTDYTVQTPIGSIVSTADKSVTTWETTPTEKSEKIFKLMADQGTLTADTACKTKEKTGKKPIVMVHRPQASYETSLRECASLILKGHTHKRQKLKRIPGEHGGSTIHHTAGSSSGAHNTISMYETPKRPATYTMFYFDADNQLRGSTTITFDTNSGVTIEDDKIPTKIEEYNSRKIQSDFIAEHKND